jgi:hypothetical protein
MQTVPTFTSLPWTALLIVKRLEEKRRTFAPALVSAAPREEGALLRVKEKVRVIAQHPPRR